MRRVRVEVHRRMSVFAASCFMMCVVLALYFSTKLNVGDTTTFNYAMAALSFALTGFAMKIGMGVRVVPEVFIEKDAVDIGIIGAVAIAVVQVAVMIATAGRPYSAFGGLIVIMMAIAEEFLFTALLDLLGATTRMGSAALYPNVGVAAIFALFHKAVYGLALPVLFVLFFGRLILNFCYLKAGLDASLIAHLLINILAVIGGG